MGTYILEQLADEYPDIYKFSASVFPSLEDDVITSPYNTTLASEKLIEYADCVFPIDNDSLLKIAQGGKKSVFGNDKLKDNKEEKK